MKNKFLSKLLSIVICICLCTSQLVCANQEITVIVDGEKLTLETAPKFYDYDCKINELMLPAEPIFKKLGFNVNIIFDNNYYYFLAANIEKDIAFYFVTGTKYFFKYKISEYNSTDDESKDSFLSNHVIETEHESIISNNTILVPQKMISSIDGCILTWGEVYEIFLISSNGYYDISTEMKQINSYMDKGMYLEAARLCKTLCSNYVLSVDDEVRISRLYDKAIENCNEDEYLLMCDDISLEINQIEKYISDGLYLEAMDWCGHAKFDTTLSKADISKLNNLYQTAKTKYEEYENSLPCVDVSSEIKQIKKHIDDKLYLEAIQLCNNAKKNKKLNKSDASTLNSLKETAQSLYNDYEHSLKIKEIEKNINNGLYLEAMQLCEKIKKNKTLSSSNLSTINNLYDTSRKKYNDYEIKQAEKYINKGLYLEAMQLCEKIKKNKTLSSSNLSTINSLYDTANKKYNNYVEKLRNTPLSDHQKQTMFNIMKNTIENILYSPSHAIWPTSYKSKGTNYYRDWDTKPRGMITFEAMNLMGGYRKHTYLFVFNNDFTLNTFYECR